ATIAGAAHAILNHMPDMDLHTFSVVYEGLSAIADEAEPRTETRNIQSIIKGYEQHAHQIAVPSFEGLITIEDLKEAAWINAHPVAISTLIPAIIYLAASRCGHRVVFDGIDGDLTTYTTERYPSSLLRSGAWREFWAECRQARVNNTY